MDSLADKNCCYQSQSSHPDTYFCADDFVPIYTYGVSVIRLDTDLKKLWRYWIVCLRIPQFCLGIPPQPRISHIWSSLLALCLQLLLIVLSYTPHNKKATDWSLQHSVLGSELTNVHLHNWGPFNGLGFLEQWNSFHSVYDRGQSFIHRFKCILVHWASKTQQRHKRS